MACLGNGELLLLGHPVLLGYDHVRQVLDVGVELDGGVPGRAGLQHAPVVLHVVLDAVVDVGDLDQEDKDQVPYRYCLFRPPLLLLSLTNFFPSEYFTVNPAEGSR